MSRSLVLFDVDGTLVDTAGAGKRAILRAFAAVHGVDDALGNTKGVRFAGLSDLRIFRLLAEAAGIPAVAHVAALDRLHDAYLEFLREEMARHDPRRRVLPGVRALLHALHGRDGVIVGLLTGNLEEGARIKLRAFDLDGAFAGGGFGSDHEDRREIARVARDTLCRAAGVEIEPGRVAVIGDTEQDVDCARARGYRAIAVASGWVPREVLEASRPDALFDDLTDLGRVLEAVLGDGRGGDRGGEGDVLRGRGGTSPGGCDQES